MKEIKCVVHFSGGLMSFGAAKMAVEKYGAENTVLLFADTGSESDDTYKFVLQAASYLGARLEVVRCMLNGSRKYVRAWDLFIHQRVPASSRLGLCTDKLKRKPLNNWIKENANNAVQVIGFSIEEIERIERLRAARPDVIWEFPLADKPYKSQCDIVAWLREAGLELPKAYSNGLPHNNCNGACFKMGIGGWARLLHDKPEVFAHHEAKEKEFQETVGKPYTILRRHSVKLDKGWRYYPLSELRADYEAGLVKPAEFVHLPCACGVLWDDKNDELPENWEDEDERA